MKKPVTVVIAGAGGRGRTVYAPYAKKFPERMKLVAVADKIQERRESMQEEYSLLPEMCFETVEELFAQPKLADMAFICTQDQDHVRHACLALDKGYDILLEKPVSPKVAECKMLLEKAQKLGRNVTVCHVLRYAPFYQKLKELTEQGAVGKVMTIQASENVAYWHQTHSFVRGNWRRSDETSPMILAKCCHDMDILVWLSGSKCRKAVSMGKLSFFRSENAPEGAPDYCLSGCPVKEKCLFDAEKIYITDEVTGYRVNGNGWMQNAVALNVDEDGLREVLKTSPYGRCVFHCDNNVVDNQTAIFEMENGISISFHLCGFNQRNYRAIHIMGTEGDIYGELDTEKIVLNRFGEEAEEIHLDVQETISGHGGGDYRMLDAMFDARERGGSVPTALEQSVESHYMAFAAEQSRLEGGKVIEMQEFVKSIR